MRGGKRRDGDLGVRGLRGLDMEEEKDLGGVLDVTVAISEWNLPEEAAAIILTEARDVCYKLVKIFSDVCHRQTVMNQ